MTTPSNQMTRDNDNLAPLVRYFFKRLFQQFGTWIKHAFKKLWDRIKNQFVASTNSNRDPRYLITEEGRGRLQQSLANSKTLNARVAARRKNYLAEKGAYFQQKYGRSFVRGDR